MITTIEKPDVGSDTAVENPTALARRVIVAIDSR